MSSVSRPSRTSAAPWRTSSRGISIKRVRLDLELVRRGLAASRTEAQRAIEAGLVRVAGNPAPRSASLVGTDTAIDVVSAGPAFVSRGGLKLDGALRRLDIPTSGRIWLDAGASTGGFTDRLLQGGAARVIAVDVGYGQLDWRLREDDRVDVMERTNVRTLAPGDLPHVPDAVVADLSFISLCVVMPALAACVAPGGDMILLVKPQFEVGREALGKGGVVRDRGGWRSALEKVTACAIASGWIPVGACVSEVPGPAGNREFFLHLRQGDDGGMGVDVDTLDDVLDEAAAL